MAKRVYDKGGWEREGVLRRADKLTEARHVNDRCTIRWKSATGEWRVNVKGYADLSAVYDTDLDGAIDTMACMQEWMVEGRWQ